MSLGLKMRSKRHSKLQAWKVAKILLFVVTLINVYVFLIRDSNAPSLSFEFLLGDGKIDWHDYEFMAYEKNRTGPGEQGAPITLTDPVEIAENEKGYNLEGIYTIVNNKIDNQRSLLDPRLPVCKTRKYLKNLPTTSVIVIFYNENWRLLMRCLHSIYNRTPKKLLKEIVLVNDKSTDEQLDLPLKAYIAEHFKDKVKFFINEERKGLIVTRMEGARKATGDVIVFLDSHMEVNVNWLPPLLEPIAENPKTAVVPIIDSFSPYTLEYQTLGHGARGSFDWTLCYQWLLLTREYQKQPGDVYQLAAMTGGAFAIRRKYFFELGGYDEGLVVWNGENYELGFKLHLCGGNIVQVPCSRVAHTTKHRTEYKEQKYGMKDYSKYNLKRVAEVWLDEYKDALYRTDPDTYYNMDPGDLTKALEVKNRLQCKPFKHYLDVIAPDLAEHFPPFDKPAFASGAIFSVLDPSKCFTYVGPEPASPLKLRQCSMNVTEPIENQYFDFTWHRNIKHRSKDRNKKNCVDTVAVNMYYCHFDFGNQFWKFDLKTHQLINPPTDTCITADDALENLHMTRCSESDMYQKFNWGYVNVQQLANWDTEGATIRGMPKENEIDEIIRADGPIGVLREEDEDD